MTRSSAPERFRLAAGLPPACRPHLVGQGHAEGAEAVLRAGKSLLLEKPLARSCAEGERIALAGGQPQAFQIDSSQPTRWTDMADQPTIKFGQPLLNNYAITWPPDW